MSAVQQPSERTRLFPCVRGAFRHILKPPGQQAVGDGGAPAPWYINDHCFLVAEDGTIHWFGITNPYPADGRLYGPGSHRHIGHASATHPFGPWRAHDHALALPDDSTDNIGASFAIRRGDQYLLFFGYNTGFRIAVSQDLFHWKVLENQERIWLGEGTRDPCIISLPDGTYLLYGAAGQGGYGGVGLAASADLLHWEPLAPALVSDVPGSWGPLESPFVCYREGWYYLLVNHSHHQYEETLVFASQDPHTFHWEAPLCTLFAHAAEVLEWNGRTYISHCGIEDRHWDDTQSPYGLYLAELDWLSAAE